jgi:3,4-dihydroxy 2-butanone 4-phosphate synthase / GTP cyclohydrolase II
MHSIPDILADLRDGKTIVLIDDEDRENEGDLVCAGEHVNPKTINFMLSQGRGMLFVAVSGEICTRLELPPQSSINTTQNGTAYTLTVDAHARHGLTTGVSAGDRAMTTRLLADPKSTASDFARPGHIQPIRAREGGTLVRPGHTEGMTDLCRLAGLQPVGVGIEVMNEDGSMARLGDLKNICAKHDLKICSIADVIQYRLEREKLVTRVETAPFENDLGKFTLIAYSSMVDPLPHVALVCGEVGKLDATGQPVDIDEPVLVRMHSQNLLGDVFGDVKQPTCDTLRASMKAIQAAGKGAVIYLRHEMMGEGLLKRLQTLSLTDDDREATGVQPPRSRDAYGIGSQILRDLGIHKLRLLTNHPFHPTALGGFGLEIAEFTPIAE